MKAKYSYAKLLKSADYKTTPWKNGKGKTAEIAIEPSDASFSKGDFLWRLSTAPILEPAPFSLFPNYDRQLAVVEGELFQLREAKNNNVISLRPGEIHRFSGEEEISSLLPSGAVKDLGLILKRSAVKAEAHHLKFKGKVRSFTLKAKSVLFYAMSGDLAVSTYPGELNFKLKKGDSLRVDALATNEERIVLCEPSESGAEIIAFEINW